MFYTILDKDGNVIKQNTQIGSYYQYFGVIKLENGDALVYGMQMTGGPRTYKVVIKSDGTIVSSSKNVGNYWYPCFIKVDTNRCLCFASDSSDNIFCSQYTETTDTMSSFTNIQCYGKIHSMKLLSNGNVLILFNNSSGNYFAIINKNRTVIKSQTHFTDYRGVTSVEQNIYNDNLQI